ncbi:ankyrin repeat domain-containing protein 49-like [Thrips palmi]|uniref:Ankyrin repeat domain-containing protein 49-like n=1 Tax=Thrips palmi TaxID=161013 RepID=A0A6P8ZK90_THRPL|nr:ankyrin repeat domain-containing protein 49-like [Thrips palmi]
MRMESDDQLIDSEEEAEIIKRKVFEAQKAVQDAGVTDEETLVEKLNGTEDTDQEDVDDSASQGSPEMQILSAAEKGKIDVIKLLLQENPELVSSRDQDGYTPLHRASYSNHPEVVKLLLQQGADVNARTCDGWTPLHSACKWNNFNCAALLLDFGSEVNPLTNGGQTPLHLASSHAEARETLFLLLSNPKISVNIRNKAGELAYDIAHRHCKYYKLFDICDPCFNII